MIIITHIVVIYSVIFPPHPTIPLFPILPFFPLIPIPLKGEKVRIGIREKWGRIGNRGKVGSDVMIRWKNKNIYIVSGC